MLLLEMVNVFLAVISIKVTIITLQNTNGSSILMRVSGFILFQIQDMLFFVLAKKKFKVKDDKNP